ncbi:TPM domain-containing protein, partial [Pseudomonas sp. BGM005]|nr:TPM domain-containing protein [Pseudomonas sp. BG5]
SLHSLSATFDASAVSTVADNPTQARERTALADRSILAAEQAIAGDRSGEAAFAIRTAEQSIAQANQLVQAISALGTELADIDAQAQALIAELQADIVTAQQLPDDGGTISAVAAATAQQLQQAQAALTGTGRSPQRVFEALTAANAQIDGVIAQGTQAVERARRAQQMLEQTLAQAGSEIRAAREYIETRRGTVGSTARTRLSQADASLTQALNLRSSNPEAAL